MTINIQATRIVDDVVITGTYTDLGLCDEPNGEYYIGYFNLGGHAFLSRVSSELIDASGNSASYRQSEDEATLALKGYTNLLVIP